MTATLLQQEPGYGPAAPVPIFQHVAEFAALLTKYRELAPMRTLEVGTFHGGTLYHWLQNAPDGATVVSVDSYTAGVDNRHLYDEWKPPDVSLHVIEGDSRDPRTVEQAAEHAPYQWVFIDAGHYYPEVLADWNNYGPLADGVVCFHDILTHANHPEIEVGQLWQELQADYETEEIIGNPNADWGGIGILHT